MTDDTKGPYRVVKESDPETPPYAVMLDDLHLWGGDKGFAEAICATLNAAHAAGVAVGVAQEREGADALERALLVIKAAATSPSAVPNTTFRAIIGEVERVLTAIRTPQRWEGEVSKLPWEADVYDEECEETCGDCRKPLSICRCDDCPTCNGRGTVNELTAPADGPFVVGTADCPHCDGTGKMP